MIRVGIIGASGYGGAELLRVLARHPEVEIAFVTSNEHEGKSVGDVHPNLLGAVEAHFVRTPTKETCSTLPAVDTVFLALPHGIASEIAPLLARSSRLIDLSGDHRLVDADEHVRHYPNSQRSQTLAESFAYGLPELFCGRILEARHVSSPGCFATATLLGLAPLAFHGIKPDMVVVDAKTGSSGAGVKPGVGTHHPDRSDGFSSYKWFSHQHVPEIAQALDDLSGASRRGGPRKTDDVDGWEKPLFFQAHSASFVRGIFASMYFELPRGSIFSGERQLRDLYAEYYRRAPFVRLVNGSPNVKWVANTNHVDIGVTQSGARVAIFVALDNLMKGAAGQAVQSFNLMHHLPETMGLSMLAGHP